MTQLLFGFILTFRLVFPLVKEPSENDRDFVNLAPDCNFKRI